MAERQMASVLRYLNNLLGSRTRLNSTDGQLLRRFIAARDEAAFAALVQRHGQLVWDVCRRLLRQDQDAEDAFQATFLILAEKAASIRKQGSLASWLYGVATRTVCNARKSGRRRRKYEQRPEERSGESPVATAALRELQEMLDEEVQHLPEKYRAPFVLCCLEGKGRSEAARELGWKEGTVSSRLAKARERLQQRLVRRGVSLTAALSAGAISANVASAAEPMARAIARNVSERATILAKGVLRNMAVSKLKIGVALVLMLGSMVAGGAAAVQRISTEKQPSAPREAAPKPAEQRRADADIHGDPLPPGAVARLGTIRFRAGGGIYSLVFSPDSKIIVSCSNDREILVPSHNTTTIRLWDASSGKQIRQLSGRWYGNQALAFSPDGQTLASAEAPYNKIRLWETASGKLRREIAGHDQSATALAFSPDGKTLASSMWSNWGSPPETYLWDVRTGKLWGRLGGHRGPMLSLAYSRDGRVLATGSTDTTALLWDMNDLTPQRRHQMLSLSPGELETLWEELDPGFYGASQSYYRAVWRLSTVPQQSVPFLERRLRLKVADPKKIPQWIADLDSDNQKTISQARLHLIEAGEAAEPALREAQKGKHTVRGQELIQELFHRDLGVDKRRASGAIKVLQLIDNTESRALLKKVAGGAPARNSPEPPR